MRSVITIFSLMPVASVRRDAQAVSLCFTQNAIMRDMFLLIRYFGTIFSNL
jgi:hypothetical protein